MLQQTMINQPVTQIPHHHQEEEKIYHTLNL